VNIFYTSISAWQWII